MTAKKPGTFELEARDGNARLGRVWTKHGSFQTPAFMPVGTQGTVKGIFPSQLREIGAQIVLANTYHLHLRPGDELIRDLGGLHTFMGWDGPILTDSGGYQVFSLSRLRTIDKDGVTFQSHIDGRPIRFTPERVVEIQENLGVDIMMVLDECLPPDADEKEVEKSWKITLDWARRSLAARKDSERLLFGIAQGGMFPALRTRACEDLRELPFDAYAIGGLSVGESMQLMREMTQCAAEALPVDKPRYLMGVGMPIDVVDSVALGVDMFDCVIPTRSARFGRLFVKEGWINIKNERFRQDPGPIEEGCDCYACRTFSRAYISHLTHAKEMLGAQLASLHNLRFYQRLMERIRASIAAGNFSEFVSSFRSGFAEQTGNSEPDLS